VLLELENDAEPSSRIGFPKKLISIIKPLVPPYQEPVVETLHGFINGHPMAVELIIFKIILDIGRDEFVPSRHD
jgi:hypothetical protein